MHEAPIVATGEIIDVIKPGLYKVRLPNGKTTLGHLSKSLRSADKRPNAGQIVEMELTPFDLDSGRISKIDG